MKHGPLALLVFLALCMAAPSLPAQLVYREAIEGELSSDGASPTPVVFSLGQNVVGGRIGQASENPIDADIFTFTIAAGFELISIEVLTYDSSGFSASFFAISGSGTINRQDQALHLSNILISGPGEILPDLAAGSYSGGVLGLTSPLGPGAYTVWFQETASTSIDYEIGYTVSPVPEPTTALLAIVACASLGALRRRKLNTTQ